MAQKYTWKQGDNLFDLAKKFNTTSQAILDLNKNIRGLAPGIVLNIPGVIPITGPPEGGPGPRGYPGTTPPTPPPPVVPYAPLPPASGQYGPKGYVGPKDTSKPGLAPITPPITQPVVQPPVLPPRLEPSRVGLPTLPPLEPSRVGQVPAAPRRTLGEQVFGVDLQGQYGARDIQRQVIGGLAGGVTRAGQQVQTFINALNASRRGTPIQTIGGLPYRNPAYEPDPTGTYTGYTPYRSPAEQLPTGTRTTPTGSAGYEAALAEANSRQALLRSLIERGMTPAEASQIIAQQVQQPAGAMDAGGYPPIVRALMERGFNIDQALLAVERGQARTETWLDNWIRENGLPGRIFKEDLLRLGITGAELIAAGYVEDEFGDWWRGGMTPGEAAQVATTGGAGGGYYPRGVGGGGAGQARAGGAYPFYGGGGQGIEINFPEGGRAFVTQQQRGVSPTGRSIRPARMGAVSWRI